MHRSLCDFRVGGDKVATFRDAIGPRFFLDVVENVARLIEMAGRFFCISGKLEVTAQKVLALRRVS